MADKKDEEKILIPVDYTFKVDALVPVTLSVKITATSLDEAILNFKKLPLDSLIKNTPPKFLWNKFKRLGFKVYKAGTSLLLATKNG